MTDKTGIDLELYIAGRQFIITLLWLVLLIVVFGGEAIGLVKKESIPTEGITTITSVIIAFWFNRQRGSQQPTVGSGEVPQQPSLVAGLGVRQAVPQEVPTKPPTGEVK